MSLHRAPTGVCSGLRQEALAHRVVPPLWLLLSACSGDGGDQTDDTIGERAFSNADSNTPGA